VFSWICPTCGREWDAAKKECPECAGQGAGAESGVARPASSLRFWLLLGGGTVLAVMGLVLWNRFLSNQPAAPPVQVKPAAKGGATLDPVSEFSQTGQIEVAGLRLSYDPENKPRVRAVVINHGADEFRGVFTVALRPAQAATDSLPLARFKVQIDAAVKPGASRELETALESLATLAAMPPWRQLRADIEK